ncbi:MAG TPA: CvpA family protein [Pontiella sp.]
MTMMHIAIDILIALFLLFFLRGGWRKGLLISLLGVIRIVLAYGLAFLSGRHLGFWLGGVAHRPRIITMPIVAALTFILITFAFHIIITHIRYTHFLAKEDNNISLSWYSRLGGGLINLTIGVFSLLLLFWLCDLLFVGISGHAIPGANRSYFARTVRKTVYKTINTTASHKGREAQVATLARVASDPQQGMEHLTKLLAFESVQQLIYDEEFIKDLFSGDPDRIRYNASMQRLFDDKPALDELLALGVVSKDEKKTILCENLAKVGRNEKIKASLKSLKERNMLEIQKAHLLIRDPDFDIIVIEMVK